MDTSVLRRIAERGLRLAQERKDSKFVDLFQHMLDEIERMEYEELWNSHTEYLQ